MTFLVKNLLQGHFPPDKVYTCDVHLNTIIWARLKWVDDSCELYIHNLDVTRGMVVDQHQHQSCHWYLVMVHPSQSRRTHLHPVVDKYPFHVGNNYR